MADILDQSDDLNGQELYRLTRVHKLPEFVKQASSDSILGPAEGLEQHQYAHPRGKHYPGHTAAATYISTLFFLDKRASWDVYTAKVIEDRLDKFAELHGIYDRVQKLKCDFNSVEKSAAAEHDDDYALIVDGERHYPLRNSHEVKAAADWLHKYKAEMPFEMRNQIATRLLEKAAKFGVSFGGELDEFLEKQAGLGGCDSTTLARFLYERSVLYKRANHTDYALKVAEMAKGVLANRGVGHDSDALVKLAALINQCDKLTGIDTVITDLAAPEDVFFSITEKKASRLRNKHVMLTSGNCYNIDDLDKARLECIRDVMGNDFADQVSTGGLFVAPEKLAEVIPTLPRGDAEIFDRLLGSMGIFPTVKTAALERSGINNTEELLALASVAG